MKRIGSPRDIPVILVLVLTLSLSIVVVYGGTSESYEAMVEINASSTDHPLQGNPLNFMERVLGVFDLFNAASILLIGVFFLGSTYSALQVSSSKIFLFPSLLMLLASLYLAGIISDSYLLIAETQVITPWFNQFPLQVELFENLGVITGLLGTVLFIATYWRRRGTVEQTGL